MDYINMTHEEIKATRRNADEHVEAIAQNTLFYVLKNFTTFAIAGAIVWLVL